MTDNPRDGEEWPYVTCPVCGDDVRLPEDARRQADVLRSIAFAMIEVAAAIERGERKPLQSYGSAIDWQEWVTAPDA